MSWFKPNSPFRSSVRGKLSSIISQQPPAPVEHDAKACFESFKNHWQQAWEMMCNSQHLFVTTSRATMTDQISGVLNHLDQMLVLLLHDLRRPDEAIGPLLDLVLTEDILNKLLSWSLRTGEFVIHLKLEQLKLYEMLIAQSQQEILVHKPILQPLLRLLSTCDECSPVEVEKRLVILLNQLCVSLTNNATLLEFFFSANCNQGSAKFLIFSLLIPFVHREGAIGQQARDALLLCMALSRKNDSIGIYIAEHSTFCPVLATGLSGLYSVLPRKHPAINAEDWHRFTPDDINEIPDLAMFLNSLEFCNAVIEVSHTSVQQQLLEYLNQGFLLPVLVPALQSSVPQACIQELSTATAYLDLFLRTITEPSLLQAFLKMLFLETSEGRTVIDSLIFRIASQHPLCVITLSLFRTLLDFNCEDVMLHLIFKYLIPCTHVMVSQRCRVREIDLFGKSAEKFLSLIPSCCLPQSDEDQDNSGPSSLESNSERAPASLPSATRRRRRTPSAASFNPGDLYETSATNQTSSLMPTSFLEYLLDARQMVNSCYLACQCWEWPYDGEQPLPEQLSPVENSTLNGAVSQDEILETVRPISSYSVTGFENTSKSSGALYDVSQSVMEDADPMDRHSSSSKLPNAALVFDNRRPAQDGVLPFYCDIAPESSGVLQTSKPKILPQLRQQKTQLLQGSVIIGPSSCNDGFGSPDLGPFLSVLLTKLENMMNNSVFENLQLTGIIARLACFPQPLLRSFLLSSSLVFQPSVKSLLQVLGTLKQKLDSFFYTVDNVDDLMHRARRYLNARDERFLFDGATANTLGRRYSNPDGVKGDKKRLSFTERLFRKAPVSTEQRASRQKNLLDGIPNETGYRYVKSLSPESPDGKLESLRTKNAVLCMVVLEEFLKELSAIAMEHAVFWDESTVMQVMW